MLNTGANHLTVYLIYMILQERDSNREEYDKIKKRQTDNFKVDA